MELRFFEKATLEGMLCEVLLYARDMDEPVLLRQKALQASNLIMAELNRRERAKVQDIKERARTDEALRVVSNTY